MHRLSHCFQQNYFYSEESFAAVKSECHLQENPVIIERYVELKLKSESTTKKKKSSCVI